MNEKEIDILWGRRNHQDNLIHTRLDWLMVTQAFLLIAYISIVDSNTISLMSQLKKILSMIIPCIGFFSIVLVLFSIISGIYVYNTIRNKIHTSENYKEAIITRSFKKIFFSGFFPLLLIPLIFLILWIIIFLYQLIITSNITSTGLFVNDTMAKICSTVVDSIVNYSYPEALIVSQNKTIFDYSVNLVSILVPLFALIIALLALRHSARSAASSDQSAKTALEALKINQEHIILSSTPQLSLIRRFNKLELPIGLEIKNVGIGPAIIKNININVDGKHIDCNNGNFMKEVVQNLATSSRCSLSSWSSEKDLFIPEGDSEYFIRTVKNTEYSNEERVELIKKFSKISIKVGYESIYGNTYTTELKECDPDEYST